MLLFLSGGPGGSQLVTARHCFADLERDYVVVTWEQPGAAKANGAISPDDITLDTYLSDGAAVTEVLREEFGQDRIYLMGESWGSALGLMLAREHPEHYRAFIGTGQMVDFLETDRIDYQTALDDARASGNQKLVSQLEEQGPPPLRVGNRVENSRLPLPLERPVGALGPTPQRGLLDNGGSLRRRALGPQPLADGERALQRRGAAGVRRSGLSRARSARGTGVAPSRRTRGQERGGAPPGGRTQPRGPERRMCTSSWPRPR